MVVNENCTDCENCVFACPVEALHLEGRAETARVETLKRRYDVVVVGAGPGGSTAAHITAQVGLAVLLLEKRQEAADAAIFSNDASLIARWQNAQPKSAHKCASKHR